MLDLLVEYFPYTMKSLPMLWRSTVETLQMTLWSGSISFVLGLALGVLLIVTRRGGILENRLIYEVLDKTINLFRSIPFIILLFCLLPLTRLISGTAIGVQGSIVPLVFGTVPFLARQMESALSEVSPGLVEAAQSMGCGRLDIICRVYLRESIPAIARGVTITLISLIGLTAMAGAVGAGGLGNFAYVYGQQRSRMDIIYSTVIVLVAIVTVIQLLGSLVARISKH
ncbi:methionine ABC transporter permease [uncultured Mailhella sp.]|uniref:methionine ABC transporter permease n=1 Tax=uncultured Mailhella sp. TaxID=1981031 RepID=UPI0025D00B09|nr:methionine ABC transporter permease [uncultured Mailhella sp.]